MSNTSMKKKVGEREREIERIKGSSRSATPELANEDAEADNECQRTWENANRVIVHHTTEPSKDSDSPVHKPPPNPTLAKLLLSRTETSPAVLENLRSENLIPKPEVAKSQANHSTPTLTAKVEDDKSNKQKASEDGALPPGGNPIPKIITQSDHEKIPQPDLQQTSSTIDTHKVEPHKVTPDIHKNHEHAKPELVRSSETTWHSESKIVHIIPRPQTPTRPSTPTRVADTAKIFESGKGSPHLSPENVVSETKTEIPKSPEPRVRSPSKLRLTVEVTDPPKPESTPTKTESPLSTKLKAYEIPKHMAASPKAADAAKFASSSKIIFQSRVPSPSPAPPSHSPSPVPTPSNTGDHSTPRSTTPKMDLPPKIESKTSPRESTSASTEVNTKSVPPGEKRIHHAKSLSSEDHRKTMQSYLTC